MNEFIRQNIGVWCQEGHWQEHKYDTYCVCQYVCVCVCVHAYGNTCVHLSMCQCACHCTCLWTVTMLIGVTAIFDYSLSRWASNLAGSKNKCRKSHLQSGNGWRACGPTQLHSSLELPWHILQHHRSYLLPAAEPSKLPFQFWCVLVVNVQWLGWVAWQNEWLWCQCHFMYSGIMIMHTTVW